MAIDRMTRSPRRLSKRISIVAAGLIAVVASGASASESVSAAGAGGDSGTKEQPGAKKPAKVYTCPMHPEVISDKPGNCPKCGMKLVLKRPAAAPPADDKK